MGWLGDTLGGIWEGIGNAAESGSLLAAGKMGVDLYTQKRQMDKMERQQQRRVIPRAVQGQWQGPLAPGQEYPVQMHQAGIVGGTMDQLLGTTTEDLSRYLRSGLEAATRAVTPDFIEPYLGLSEHDHGAAGSDVLPYVPAGRSRAPLPGGIYMGSGDGMFRTTRRGNRVANKITLIKDAQSNKLSFFAHAGAPTAFSKVSLKKSAPKSHTHKVKHRHSKKRRSPKAGGARKGSHSNARARALLKAVAANKKMSPASKAKARATIKRNHPSLR